MKFKEFLSKNQSNLLVGGGVAGLITSNFFTAKAASKSMVILSKKAVDENKELKDYKFKDRFKSCWKLYIPSVLIGAASIAAIIAGMKINNKKIVALGAAYSLSEAMIGEYQRKLINNVGAQKAAEINQQVSQEVMNKAPLPDGNSKAIMLTDDGETLFYEPLSGRYFKSNWNKIQEACNKLNESALGGLVGTFTMNDWYVAIGLDTNATGDILGWGTPGSAGGNLLKIELDSTVTKDNKPCGYIRYIVMPKSLS